MKEFDQKKAAEITSSFFEKYSAGEASGHFCELMHVYSDHVQQGCKLTDGDTKKQISSKACFLLKVSEFMAGMSELQQH